LGNTLSSPAVKNSSGFPAASTAAVPDQTPSGATEPAVGTSATGRSRQ
jgi:hypothetical protein